MAVTRATAADQTDEKYDPGAIYNTKWNFKFDKFRVGSELDVPYDIIIEVKKPEGLDRIQTDALTQ